MNSALNVIMTNEFLTIALVHVLAVASPGPDFAIVIRHSMHYGKRIALITSVGIGMGILVHVAYSIFGLSLIIATTPWLFTALKTIAGVYLIYLGVNALRSQPVKPATVAEHCERSSQSAPLISNAKAFMVGFITNGINPKATLFFLSLFTVVVAPTAPLSTKLFYGGYLSVATACWFCMLSLLLNGEKVSSWLQQFSYWIDRAMGVLLLVVATNILFFAHV